MSLRSAIPWRFALQHGPPPLHRPVSIFGPPEVICQPAPSGKYRNWTRRPRQGKISTQGWAKSEYRSGPDRSIKLNLALMAISVAALSPSLGAQTQPLGVCEALNSASDHQAVVLHAAVAASHQTYLFEGTGQEPCPGWRTHFFSAFSVIPIVFGSFSGINVPDNVRRELIGFGVRLRGLQRADPSARHMVTMRGVLVRKPLALGFKGTNGQWGGWGEGLDGAYAAVLVVTAPPIEDQ